MSSFLRMVPRRCVAMPRLPIFAVRVAPLRAFSVFAAQSKQSNNHNNGANSKSQPFRAAAAIAALSTVTLFAVNQAKNDGKKEEKKDEKKTVGGVPVVDWAAVRRAIVDILDDENYDDGSRGPLFVRLAWHAAGTYCMRTKTGGSHGATMRFEPESKDGANAGLHLAREWLEPIKSKFAGVTYADLWTLAGSVAIEEMGGPKIDWRAGRSDAADAKTVPPVGRLPDASKKEDHVRDVFYRMGFSDQEIVALLGAHALGRCHKDRSGYEGPWTRAPTTFSNEFFRVLLEEQWTERKWNGPKQFQDKTGELMMTPADLALRDDPKFRPYVELYAKDQAKFFNDFAKAWKKLIELGVPSFTLGHPVPAVPAPVPNVAKPSAGLVPGAPVPGAGVAPEKKGEKGWWSKFWGH
jgi:cytochrome c peroxidase